MNIQFFYSKHFYVFLLIIVSPIMGMENSNHRRNKSVEVDDCSKLEDAQFLEEFNEFLRRTNRLKPNSLNYPDASHFDVKTQEWKSPSVQAEKIGIGQAQWDYDNENDFLQSTLNAFAQEKKDWGYIDSLQKVIKQKKQEIQKQQNENSYKKNVGLAGDNANSSFKKFEFQESNLISLGQKNQNINLDKDKHVGEFEQFKQYIVCCNEELQKQNKPPIVFQNVFFQGAFSQPSDSIKNPFQSISAYFDYGCSAYSRDYYTLYCLIDGYCKDKAIDQQGKEQFKKNMRNEINLYDNKVKKKFENQTIWLLAYI